MIDLQCKGHCKTIVPNPKCCRAKLINFSGSLIPAFSPHNPPPVSENKILSLTFRPLTSIRYCHRCRCTLCTVLKCNLAQQCTFWESSKCKIALSACPSLSGLNKAFDMLSQSLKNWETRNCFRCPCLSGQVNALKSFTQNHNFKPVSLSSQLIVSVLGDVADPWKSLMRKT